MRKIGSEYRKGQLGSFGGGQIPAQARYKGQGSGLGVDLDRVRLVHPPLGVAQGKGFQQRAQDILFATNSTEVSGRSQADLRTLANSMNQYPNTTVNVIGHTDNVGDASFNFDLSQRRAQAVTSVLISSGVSPSRIVSTGRGEDAPVATNLTAEGRQANRRVEIVITPNG